MLQSPKKNCLDSNKLKSKQHCRSSAHNTVMCTSQVATTHISSCMLTKIYGVAEAPEAVNRSPGPEVKLSKLQPATSSSTKHAGLRIGGRSLHLPSERPSVSTSTIDCGLLARSRHRSTQTQDGMWHSMGTALDKQARDRCAGNLAFTN